MHPIRYLRRLSRGFASVGEVWGLSEKWAKLKTALKYGLYALIGLAILVYALWWSLPDDWRIKYAAERWTDADWIDTDQVIVERKPHTCEWSSAPLGDKH